MKEWALQIWNMTASEFSMNLILWSGVVYIFYLIHKQIEIWMVKNFTRRQL